jgi:hypothetical protein
MSWPKKRENAPVGGDIEAGELVTFFHFGAGDDADGIMMTMTAEGEDTMDGSNYGAMVSLENWLHGARRDSYLL